ncbi:MULTISPECIES: NUDIX domain-containing protein [Brevibacillus]|uniref:NUDIX domain-containing protein n=1 Tax=Brevibacillus invocatus TaxID=173959 RepID=A0A3M8CG70_9BACL|nr:MULTISPECIES: NUDIX domain-containing protein [Brevibacillus]MCM3080762.1 NUDIX domain-containing protein [Brevibacillus invocatus]MCM3430949.1 NUDIX domain-containing protein [Brevibacillus invocatus]MDH4618571.1 NUDIX domain-containing protein [Brevibacillus sp. AY1]RNB74599.1 NUDIX domain-containing protein [Brevibacillus invocatus]
MKTIGMRVTVVVEHQGCILLIKEKRSRGQGYSLPGGHIEFLESIAEATRREVWEETGLLVEMERMLWVDDRIDRAGAGKHTIGIAVLAKLVGEETNPIPGGLEDEQIEWAGWVSLDEWKSIPLHQGTVRLQVLKALTGQGYLPDYLGNVLEKQEE